MNKIQLLYVENVITRKKAGAQQTLSFFYAGGKHQLRQTD